MTDHLGTGAGHDSLDALGGSLAGTLALPGSDAYAKATTPWTTTASQFPLAVVVVKTAEDVSTTVRWAVAAGLRVVPQATGHGAGRDVEGDTVIIDTSDLRAVEVDTAARTVRVGAGAMIGEINREAWRHGLLLPGGTAPDVGIVGYTCWGGVGWLTRPYGLASAALLAAEVVDATGRIIHADDHTRQDLLWAYRGGGGVGVATQLTFGLYPGGDLWAGYALWPFRQLRAVSLAWAEALPTLHPALSTSLAVLHAAPDTPAVPQALRGQPVVHLAASSVSGIAAGQTVVDLLRALDPAVDTFGPCDADRLATIHLDPPVPVPAVGTGRWLTGQALPHVADILSAAGGLDSPLGEVELRWVATPESSVPGAMTSCPSPLLLHATGAGPDRQARAATQYALDAILARVAPFDTGRAAGAFCDGQLAAPDALSPTSTARLRHVRHQVDPHGHIQVARPLT